MYSLDRKVVIITGASEGIGAEVASILRGRGARLVVAARNEEKLRQVGGPDALCAPGDLTSEPVREALIRAAASNPGFPACVQL